MGVKITHEDRVTVGVIEKSIEVCRISGGAGGDGRDVYVVDVEDEMTQVYLDGENFQVGINASEIRDIQRLELNVVADEDGEAATTASDTIAPKKGVSWKRRVRIVFSELRLLYTSDLDIVFVQERSKLALRGI